MQSSGTSQKFILPPMGSAVLAGLLVTQIVSTIAVYVSNQQLHRKITAIHESGYLAVPGLNIIPQLTTFSAAFWGGLFFTLTAGAALSLLACLAAWIYKGRSRAVIGLFLLIWLAFIYMVNANGIALFPSLLFLMAPPVGFYLRLKGFFHHEANQSRLLQKLNHSHLLQILTAAPLVLLAIFWFTRMDARLFENIRDHLLLTNPVGTKINDFYYRYTLYPAEVFKPISHKTLRTCKLTGIEDPAFRKHLSAQLRRHDYLAIDDVAAADLIVEKKNGQLTLSDDRRLVVTAEPDLFLRQPQPVLTEFSQLNDRFEFFRTFTFYGILIGFPILLYLVFFGLLRLVFGLFLAPKHGALIAASFCLVAGVAAWIPIYQAGRVEITAETIQPGLKDASRHKRIAALRFIEENAVKIESVSIFDDIKTSPHIPERYWLARALASGRDKDSYGVLLFLLSDPHPNVVCQALYALGQRGNRSVIPEVIQTIKTSKSWYIQRYGYNTIRKLGWHQPAST